MEVLYLLPLKSKRLVMCAVVAEALVTEILPASIPVAAVSRVPEVLVKVRMEVETFPRPRDVPDAELNVNCPTTPKCPEASRSVPEAVVKTSREVETFPRPRDVPEAELKVNCPTTPRCPEASRSVPDAVVNISRDVETFARPMLVPEALPNVNCPTDWNDPPTVRLPVEETLPEASTLNWVEELFCRSMKLPVKDEVAFTPR